VRGSIPRSVPRSGGARPGPRPAGPRGWPELGRPARRPGGRFVQRDPEKEGVNWYGYVGEMPLVGVDPRGLKKIYCKKPVMDCFIVWVRHYAIPGRCPTGFVWVSYPGAPITQLGTWHIWLTRMRCIVRQTCLEFDLCHGVHWYTHIVGGYIVEQIERICVPDSPSA